MKKVGFGFVGVSRSIFDDNFKHGKAPKPHGNILVQKTLVFFESHWSETIHVFNIRIWGFGDI